MTTEKIVQLAQTQQEIAVYLEMLEMLATQEHFYKKRLHEAETRLKQQHESFLEPEPTTAAPGMTVPFDRMALSELATANGRVS